MLADVSLSFALPTLFSPSNCFYLNPASIVQYCLDSIDRLTRVRRYVTSISKNSQKREDGLISCDCVPDFTIRGIISGISEANSEYLVWLLNSTTMKIFKHLVQVTRCIQSFMKQH